MTAVIEEEKKLFRAVILTVRSAPRKTKRAITKGSHGILSYMRKSGPKIGVVLGAGFALAWLYAAMFLSFQWFAFSMASTPGMLVFFLIGMIAVQPASAFFLLKAKNK